jgi:hypothetical protein
MNEPYFLSMPVDRQLDQETLVVQMELELSRLSSTPSSSTSSSTLHPVTSSGQINERQWPICATNTNIVGNNNTYVTNVTIVTNVCTCQKQTVMYVFVLLLCVCTCVSVCVRVCVCVRLCVCVCV